MMLICPWSAGGGTDRVSRQVASLLSRDLGVPVNVVNATGGAGVTGHTRGALARPDGYTITMVTCEINMLHWRGLTNISHLDYEPVGLLNRDAAAVFVREDAPWQDLDGLEAHIRNNPGKLKASGTAQGGIWHLGFAGWLDHQGVDPGDAIWVSINGSAPSLQELIAGGVEVACCSLPEAQPLLDAGRIRCLGVMTDERLEPYPDVPTFREQGVDWTLASWRGICLPKGCPPEIRERLSAALGRMAQGNEFRDFLRSAGFDATWQPPEEFATTMQKVDEQYGKLLTSETMQSMQRERFGPMLFPNVLALLGGVVFLGLIATGQLKRSSQAKPLSLSDVGRLAEIVVWVVAYVLLAETLGFLLTAGLLVVLLLLRLGNRWLLSVAVGVVVVAATYQLFALALRVPLPRGWLGW
ncbi:MAG: tripartite tricarboxylate transporter substrate binding protein [Planctomycetes bacterium]|nr:tripartite tricarboxylate transporter substrate binding protein [Planctomycetota bacterium]